MKKFVVAAGMACAVIGLGIGAVALGNGGVKGVEPGMMVSPHTILLSETIAVTVHTNILRSTVDDTSVRLEDVAPLDTWADDLGHLAARFLIEEMGLTPSTKTMTLCGDYNNGGSFAAEDEVRVKQQPAAGPLQP